MSLEFEKTPVPENKRQNWKSFLGLFAGEHAAGTEFMIGPLFLAAGASLGNLLIGLFLGNVLAILTWRYLVAPIAVSRGLTLYYQLERIAGFKLVKLYNVVNGVLFCFLAGAMITVSASAIGVPFNVVFEIPENIFGLSSIQFTMIVLIVGAVIGVVAIAGYNTVSHFANIAAPWMIIVFALCGLSALSRMGIHSIQELFHGSYWTDAVAVVQAKNGVQDFGLWKIVIFSWLCNGAMHFGMADLSILRFGKDSRCGWGPSIGMFLGHYMAWICAALMLAAQIKQSQDTTANPGILAWDAIGWTGIICVIIAGWTTANPTIYRAGLAFQTLLPKSFKNGGVILAGVVATVAGVFPNLSAKLLDFVGLYGTILGPMGGIIFVNHYFAKKLGFKEDYAEHANSSFNSAVLFAWLIPVAIGLYLYFGKQVFPAYAVIPCWIGSSILYIVLMKFKKAL